MSYIATNPQQEKLCNYTILQVDNSSCSVESSYTWSNLIQDEYQFSVVAFTSKGPGEAASLMLSTLSNDGKLILVTMAILQDIFKKWFLQKLMINISLILFF